MPLHHIQNEFNLQGERTKEEIGGCTYENKEIILKDRQWDLGGEDSVDAPLLKKV